MKKSTKNIPISIIYEKFNFIQEGSIIIKNDGIFFLISCKELSSIENFDENLDFELFFNPIMQGEFPTLELKINFYKNKIKFDDISYLMSVQDMKDLKNICHLFSNELFHIGIFNKKNRSLQLYELENDYKNELASNLKYFKIDIKDIIKNTKS
tara:strand:- start:2000 stop:2461 length:462 start_codon:yes stop_codon:yes gene_type:complete